MLPVEFFMSDIQYLCGGMLGSQTTQQSEDER